MLTSSGVDTGDPEFAEITFSDTSIAEGVCTTAKQRLFDGSRQFAAAAAVTLGALKETFFGLITG